MTKTQTIQQMIQAYSGTELHTKGWVQEAALRMLLNNLNPDVAERTASSVNVTIGTTGPNVSSVKIFIFELTSARTVGAQK